MNTIVKKLERYQELDALRGIAALLVVFFHLTMSVEDNSSFLKLGVTGVDLFFIISGFVIFMSLQNNSNTRVFIINRICRLYPTYWAAVIFTFLIILTLTIYNSDENVLYLFPKFIINLTMLQFYFNVGDIDGTYWTLIIELLFYAFILGLFKSRYLKYFKFIGVFICSITIISCYYFYDVEQVKNIISWIPLFQFFPLFFSGIIFYKIFNSNEKVYVNYLLIIFCLLCQISLFPYSGRSHLYISWADYSIMMGSYFILFSLFVNNRLKMFVNKVTLFFGKISYALYLIHQYISVSIIIPLFYHKLQMNFWCVIFFIDLPIIICIATLITYKLEIPFSKKMKDKLYALL